MNITRVPGRLVFRRRIAPVTSDEQTIVRMNRDTLYGMGVFDLNSPVTIELPPNEGRYLSLYALDNDQYSLALLHSNKTESASITFSYSNSESESPKNSNEDNKLNSVISQTRYIAVIIRVFVDPLNTADVLKANRLLDEIKVSQAHYGEWKWPNWNVNSLIAVRNSIAALLPFVAPFSQLNGYRNTIDPTLHQIGTATGWGGNPPEEAVYSIILPPSLTDLNQIYYIEITSPSAIPINPTGFWSVTVYNDKGYLQYNNAFAYSVNGVTARPESDGSIRIYFSNTRSADMKNWIYIFPGWNYLIRLYLPQTPILTHTWTFPSLQQL